MFEFNGWISINYHTHDSDLEQQKIIFCKIKTYLENHPQLDSLNYKVINHNGLNSFLISGQHNHRQLYVIEIFRWIGQQSIGSYGILYIRDDEEEDTVEQKHNSNMFKVWVLKRGEIHNFKDTFLSPIVPTIEDEYDSLRND